MESFLSHTLRARALVWPIARPLALLLFLCATASGQSILKPTIASSGGTMKNVRGALTMTIGQAAAGRIVNASVDLHGGFLPPPRPFILSADAPTEGGLHIYPLPAVDNFRVDLPDLPALSVALYDASGRMYVLERNISRTVVIDLADIPAGGYFVRVYSGSSVVQTEMVTVIR